MNVEFLELLESSSFEINSIKEGFKRLHDCESYSLRSKWEQDKQRKQGDARANEDANEWHGLISFQEAVQ
jgi:hypothetical protein